MKSGLPNKGEPAIDALAAYEAAFLVRVHELLALGHQRLDAASYCQTDEVTISGDLTEKIDEVLHECGEGWMKFYHTDNERPEQSEERKGKRRKQVDLAVKSGEHRPQLKLRFCWEAKRLSIPSDLNAYFGEEGLGCFLEGHYAAEFPWAGMLGYAQQGAPSDWLDRVEERLSEFATRVVTAPLNAPLGSDHKRSIGSNIRIYHSILKFR